MAVPIIAIVEGIKLLFQSVIALAKIAGMTEENTEEIFRASWQKLKERDPAELPDV
jgi:hypothetical protein